MRAVVIVENVTLDRIVLIGENFVNLVEPVRFDDLVGDDEVVLGAEVDAILRLFDAADDAAGDAQTPEDQRSLHELMRGADDTQLYDGSVQSQKRKVVRNLLEWKQVITS